jgi:amino acid adenylation domain-containing protein
VKLADLLAYLQDRNISVRAEGDELKVRALRGSLAPEDVAILREHKAMLLAELRRAGRWGVELSGQLERLWYLDRLEPDLTGWVLQGAVRLRGPLHTGHFEAALRDFVERHDLGRVHIRSEGGRPYLDFAPETLFSLERVDAWKVLRNTRDEHELLDWVAELGNKPIPLDAPPLIRFTLLRFADDDHVFSIRAHHAIWDGWGFDLCYRDVSECYAARLEGRAPVLPPLEAGYGDYVRSQRERISGVRAKESERFWGEALGGTIPDLELVSDRARPAHMTYGGHRVHFDLAAEALPELKAFAKESRATLFLVVLTAYTALLHRLTGQEDLIVGVPVQGRHEPRFDDVVGFFVNTMDIRARPSPAMTFRELLRQVSERAIGALDHQDTPFEWIVRRFARRDPSRTPIFQTLLTHQYAVGRPSKWGNVTPRSLLHPIRATTFDLSVWIREYGDRLDAGLDVRSDLFDLETAAAMVNAFQRLIVAAVRQPDLALRDLPLLSEAEAIAETTGRRGPTRDVASLGSFLERVAQHAAATPTAVAVEDERGAVRYDELRTRAGAVAAALRSRDVKPGDPVVVLVERDRHLPALILGILRAGAVYLPFDANFPAARLRFMANDSGVHFAVVDASTRGIALDIGLAPLMKDELMMAAAPEPLMFPAQQAPAYRFYTSGSTGEPKAVEVPHGALTNFLAGAQELLELTPRDVLLAVTTVSFDISLLELLLPLTTGGRVVVASADETLNAPALAARIRSKAVTVMQATPATWRLLLDDGWKGGLRIALSGGEALPRAVANGLQDHCGTLYNMYGPTETTIWSTARYVTKRVDVVPIGRPLLNTAVYVLDRERRPVPQGVPGEIWIGGAGVATGYVGRPELTASRFVPDPFDPSPRARMYRTGDMGRWLPDGALVFLGRTDAQVKVHGYRIELAEVEAVLESLPGIREAAVDARGDDADRRLIGWVLHDESVEDPPTVSELRRELRHRLPAYMVPAILVPVTSMPRTANGKLDRRQLRDPTRVAVADRTEFARPIGAMEEAIATEWRRLLSVEQVGRHDNFFELGGYSLLSLQAVAAIEQRTGRRIDPRRFFFSTLAQLAE